MILHVVSQVSGQANSNATGRYILTFREDSSQNCKNVAKMRLCTNNSLIQAMFLTMQNMIVLFYWREIAKNECCKAFLHCLGTKCSQQNGQKLCTSNK